MPNTTLSPYRFDLDGKALVASPASHGDLILEGWAARWTVDRQDEAFLPTAFDAGIKAFVNGTAALCFNHRRDHILGKVLSLERKPEGLWMKARVDGAVKTHPTLGVLYHQIKSGSLRGASVGGFFRRLMTPEGPRIDGVDLVEVSVTGTPVGGHGTTLSVVAGKALGDLYEAPDRLSALRHDLHVARAAGAALDRIDARLQLIELRDRVRG